MKLNQLRALITIAECQSIHEAARQLHVTQPALSKTVQELESSVGATLLERSSTGTRLTPAGHRLLAHARLIMESVQHAKTDLDDMQDGAGGTVTIGTTPLTAMLQPMIDTLDGFRAAYPDVRLRVLEMRPNQLVEQLRQGAIDMAVSSHLQSPDRFFQSIEVSRLSSVIVARPEHPLRNARSLRVLRQADWISLDPLPDRQSSFSRLFSENGLEPPLRVTECASIHLAMELCWRANLLLVLSSESMRSEFLSQRVAFLDIAEPQPAQPICLLRHNHHVLTGPAERLHNALLQGFAAQSRRAA
ncbi:LysR family transcriptional regulator [Cupriavidus plantarum]|uniref:LysR family transcriptional regulator n=1 Tax=Cupriavidus plantarum TaxID=942865 RepID=A0A316EPH7_9BURK|nr:LysR family transcriptional regulator [Cupriavidus plantarum]NYI02073.1 molybdate transport repressor ModE-like protein [Cupriavidus plantarum]PWK34208.1 LysR family transcriptional regulator [Cupriavidus plantarum]RLK31733.1 LysR family transcriptional regulator [Cupriavidus plantarum]CAG2139278.1 HTH-type transcriptional regulator HdfR [Cupriavidus plantarum]SMR85744.1 transcriptional regulator, LysR family [Cupriavidus plantarum]